MHFTKPYTHGGNVNEAALRYGIRIQQPVIDFSVNLNPLGPPKIIQKRWPAWFESIYTYPSQNGRGIEEFYHKRFHLPRGTVMGGNGSIELIYMVPRALKIKKALIFTPSFHDYARACVAAGAEVTEVPLIKNHKTDFPLDVKTLSLIGQSDAVFIGNPNNPTGSLMGCETIIGLAKKFPSTWFLIDEAFSQFLENRSTYSLMTRQKLHENIIVFHSLTKFYALPGLRMGAAVSHPNTITRLTPYKEPWTVNALAEKAAESLMECAAYEDKTRQRITEQRQVLFQALKRIPAIKPYKTPANFIFARLDDSNDLDNLILRLLKKSFFIRDCRNFKGLSGNYFRISVRGIDDNFSLIQALNDIYGSPND